MPSFRVTSPSLILVNIAAYFSTPVLLTLFELIAYFLTLPAINFLNFIRAHEFLFFVESVVDLIAEHRLFLFTTWALLHSGVFTLHTVIVMTSLNALVLATR